MPVNRLGVGGLEISAVRFRENRTCLVEPLGAPDDRKRLPSAWPTCSERAGPALSERDLL